MAKKNETEKYVTVPFLVLFMRVFEEEKDARELLTIAVNFLLSREYNLLTAEIIKSKFEQDVGFSLRIAWKGSHIGYTQIMHDGSCLSYYFNPYSETIPKEPTRGEAIAGDNFMPEWLVRVPIRLVHIYFDDEG